MAILGKKRSVIKTSCLRSLVVRQLTFNQSVERHNAGSNPAGGTKPIPL